MALLDGFIPHIFPRSYCMSRLEAHPCPALLRTPGPRLLTEENPDPAPAAGWWPENLLLFLFSFILNKRHVGPVQ